MRQRALSTSTAHGSTNGGAPGDAPSGRRPRSSGWSVALIGAIADEAQRRVPTADLDERDPDYIRETLPGLWMLASLYFRADVRGLQNIPEEGPVLLVGNHSGGNLTPDTHVFTLAFSTYFGVERRFHQLAHNLVLSMPGPRHACASTARWRRPRRTRRWRSTRAPRCSSTRAATTRCTGRAGSRRRSTSAAAGASSAWRRSAASRWCPWWRSAARRRRSSSRAASGLAKLLGLDRMFRLKVLPISLALPWGLNVGDMLGHIPLPGEAHHPGAGADRRVRHGRGRGLRAASRARCSAPSPGSPRSARCRWSADARRARHPDRRLARGDLGARRRTRATTRASGTSSPASSARTTSDGLGARFALRMRSGRPTSAG